MSFSHLIHKPTSRLALDNPDHANAIVLFDPKTAHATLVDARKTLQKEYEARNLRAIEVDEAVEEAGDRVERARKGERGYWRGRKRKAEDLGLVEKEDGEEEDLGLRGEMAEARAMALEGEEEDGEDDEDWNACSGEKPLRAYVEDEDDEDLLNLEPNWSGEQAFDEDGNPVHPALLEKRKQRRRQREADIQSQEARGNGKRKTKEDLAVQTHLPTCEDLYKRKDSPGLIPQPWTVEQEHNLAQGPIGRGNMQNIGGVFVPGLTDARVAARAEVAAREVLEAEDSHSDDGYAYMTAAEEENYVFGEVYEVLGPQFPYDPLQDAEGCLTTCSTPEWAKEEVLDAEATLKAAREAVREAEREMRDARSEAHRVKNMIGMLENEFPELAGTVRCYTQRQEKRRKRETLDADAGDPLRAKKRRRTEMVPEERRQEVGDWHAVYRSLAASSGYSDLIAFPAPPSWPCGKPQCSGQSTKTRLLKACKHNIKSAVADLSDAELKKCKIAFHPDRFHVCVERKREEWLQMAGEVFVVVGREAEKRVRTEEGADRE